MRKIIFAVSMVLIFGITGLAEATLFDRGGGLIYCDTLDITWLQDAEYAKTSGYSTSGHLYWDDAIVWADSLEYFDSVRGVTYDDWRLPSALNADGSGPDEGYNITSSEMGHLFYVELGNPSGTLAKDWYTLNVGPFINVQHYDPFNGTYWMSEERKTGSAWDFVFLSGWQGSNGTFHDFNVWAVRDGDVGAASIPEPSTWILLCSVLIGMVGIRMKFS